MMGLKFYVKQFINVVTFCISAPDSCLDKQGDDERRLNDFHAILEKLGLDKPPTSEEGRKEEENKMKRQKWTDAQAVIFLDFYHSGYDKDKLDRKMNEDIIHMSKSWRLLKLLKFMEIGELVLCMGSLNQV